MAICRLLGGHLLITDTVFEHLELVVALRDINFTQSSLPPPFDAAWFGIISENLAYTWEHTGKNASNPDNGYVNWALGHGGAPAIGKMCSCWQNGIVSICPCEMEFKIICEHDIY